MEGRAGRRAGHRSDDIDDDGDRDLVGVNLKEDEADARGIAPLTRTVIELDGTTASHGFHDEITALVDDGPTKYIGTHCGPLSLTPEILSP